MVDFTRYQPPGVYIQDTTSPIVTSTGVAPSVVCLIGPAQGYQTLSETLLASAPASPPVQANTSVTHTDGGAFGSNTTYYYVVTAVDSRGQESTVSNEKSGVVTAATDSVTISWASVTGAAHYRVYRGTVTASENKLLATVSGLSFKDLGAAGTSTSLPTLNLTNSVPLTEAGVYLPGNSAGIAAPVVALLDGTTLVYSSDYALHYDSTTGLTSIRLIAGGSNLNGNTSETVSVTYNYQSSGYFDPQEFVDYASVVDVYGQPLVITAPTDPMSSQVASPLSLAAKVAFENGATDVILVALDPGAGSGSLTDQFSDAYAKIVSDPDVAMVVVLPVGTGQDEETYVGFAQALDAHCLAATLDGNPRIGIIGVPQDITLDASANGQGAVKAIAAAVHSSRVMVSYPEALNLYNGAINQTTTVDGLYLAAAYAGRFQALPFQNALTKQTIRSFNGVPASVQQRMTRANKDSMSSAGVAVAEISRQGVLTVRHGVATDMTSVLTREVSITRARDALSILLQEGMDASGMVGQPITNDTPILVQSAVTGILENAKSTGLFVDYSGVAVRQQEAPSGDPTYIEVKFAYKPAIPLNYIVVSFSIDLSTGTTDLSGLTTTTTQ